MGACAAQVAVIFELIDNEYVTPLVWRDAKLFLDFGLNALNGVSQVGVKLHNLEVEDLHEFTKPKFKVKGNFVLLVADVAQVLYVFELAAGRVESLQVWGVSGDDLLVFLRIALILEFLF